jgi:hypothetical protein
LVFFDDLFSGFPGVVGGSACGIRSSAGLTRSFARRLGLAHAYWRAHQNVVICHSALP